MDSIHFVIIDVSLCISFVVFIVLLMTSKSNLIGSSYFVFFISTGVAGMIMTLSGWFPLTYYLLGPEEAWIIHLQHILSGGSRFAHLLGQLMMLANRYSVLSRISVNKVSWSEKMMKSLLIAQFSVPFILHLSMFATDLAFEDRNGVLIHTGLGNLSGQIYRGICGMLYVVFVIVSFYLNVQTVKRFREIVIYKKLANSSRLSLHKCLVIHGACYSAVGIVFSIHQFLWSYSFLVGNATLLKVLREAQNYTNDLTTFMNPVLLVAASPQVRRVLMKRLHFELTPKITDSTSHMRT